MANHPPPSQTKRLMMVFTASFYTGVTVPYIVLVAQNNRTLNPFDINPFRNAVSSWRQTSQISKLFAPKTELHSEKG